MLRCRASAPLTTLASSDVRGACTPAPSSLQEQFLFLHLWSLGVIFPHKVELLKGPLATKL